MSRVPAPPPPSPPHPSPAGPANSLTAAQRLPTVMTPTPRGHRCSITWTRFQHATDIVAASRMQEIHLTTVAVAASCGRGSNTPHTPFARARKSSSPRPSLQLAAITVISSCGHGFSTPQTPLRHPACKNPARRNHHCSSLWWWWSHLAAGTVPPNHDLDCSSQKLVVLASLLPRSIGRGRGRPRGCSSPCSRFQHTR